MVKDGFKQTDIGVIPEDWEIKSFEKIANISRGASPRPIQSPIWFDNNSSIGWVRISDVTKSGKYLFQTEQKLSNLGVEKSRFVEKDNLIMSICATLGRPILTSFDVCIHDGFVVFKNLVIEKNYMYYYLRYIQNQWAESGQVGTQVNLNTDLINHTKIPIPPKEEQKAIAKALSDTDELISSLEKLISKKEAIKQGTMQQLLTGKKRLSGFSGEWNSYTIEEIAINLDNLRIPLNENQRSRMRGDIPYCGANGVVGFVNDYVIDDDILLMAEDGGYFDEWATRPIVYRMIGKCWVNNHAHILKAKESFSQDYLFYSLVHKDITKFLASGTRAKLNKSEMYKIQVIAPEDIKEQQSIAQILSDMDNEIESLKAKLSKTKAIKDGMMSELLTGKTRLVS